MIGIGILFGTTFHSIVMPFFGGQFFHCIAMGLIYGTTSFFAAYYFYEKFSILKDDNRYLSHNLRVDTLTDLLNRRAFDSDIQLFNERDNFSIIFLDIDNFREFNNKYGHSVGDLILKKVSYVIKLALSESDMGYRYGGEEVVIIIPDKHKQEAQILAEEIRNRIANLVNTPYPSISVSIGVANYPEDGHDVHEVINAGDYALLKAKSLGKNRTVAFDENLRINI
jgi:diguanylate cyclase